MSAQSGPLFHGVYPGVYSGVPLSHGVYPGCVHGGYLPWCIPGVCTGWIPLFHGVYQGVYRWIPPYMPSLVPWVVYIPPYHTLPTHPGYTMLPSVLYYTSTLRCVVQGEEALGSKREKLLGGRGREPPSLKGVREQRQLCAEFSSLSLRNVRKIG